ncbi:MAG: HEAT repeat domain-containing protein [Chloroflexota bacterium]|nr:HEAT repeat domain-containing protein [Chloroflexota bacterium]
MSDARVQEPIATYLDWIRRSKNPNERREAALQLGERAYADAIPDLIRLYQKDKNKNVRAAAAYSLGMFRAAEITLQTRDRDDVYELLQQVDEGELGARSNSGALIRRIVALLLTFIALIVAFVLLPERVPTVNLGPIRIASSLSEDDAPIIVDLREGYTKLRDNSNNLRTELDALIAGGALTCQAFFNELFPYELSSAAASAYPTLASVAADYNSGVSIFGRAIARYDTACFGTTPLTPEEATAVNLSLLPLNEALPRIENGLAAASVQPTAIPPTPIPPTDVPVIAPTEVPIVAPTDSPTLDPAAPTLDPALITPTVEVPTIEAPTAEPTSTPPDPTSVEPTIEPTLTPGEGAIRHINALYNIIDQVTNPRGASALLVSYWQDVVDTGATTGCNAPLPTIPANYVDEIEADLSNRQGLLQAAQLVNVALETLRGGWVTFRGTCSNGGLPAQGQSQLGIARSALNSFTAARTFLDTVRARS